LLDRAHLQGSAMLRFNLPDPQKTQITGVAVVRWSQGALFGMKFTVDNASRKAYRQWLSSMPLA
jgi:hypothetical protein